MTPAPIASPAAPRVPLEPSWRLMMSHPAHQLSFGFGSGLVRPAPGTWGTLFAWLVFVVIDPWLSDPAWAGVIVATFLLGAAAAQRTGKALGRPDHGSIVIDEIVAFWLVLWLLPAGVFTQAVAFVGFRVFDILKPPPIRAVDRRYKNGLGVMLDDLLAAFYTLLAAAVLTRLFA
ncbi:MAG TPA: phosphatidylglycerophosphatase A [Gemmatimonadaceae bacterium]|nr:phosphatidylglycerophosphatase A [Gemmatimonadaceae bacterium]